MFVFGAFICDNDDKSSAECRIYLEEEAPNYFTALYIVPSPQGKNSNWGSNIVNDYEILQSYGWKMYKFSPGTYDIKLKWAVPDDYTGSASFEEYDQAASDKEGKQYCAADNGALFITTFIFE